MKKIILVISALLTLVMTSCNHGDKAEKVSFQLHPDGHFSANGETPATIEVDGSSQQELYSMVKNNIMKFYRHPDLVLSENAPTSLVVNGFTDNVFYGLGSDGFASRRIRYSVTYRILFEFADNMIKVTPNFEQVVPSSPLSNVGPMSFEKMMIFYTIKTEDFPPSFLPEKRRIEYAVDVIVNYLLWGDKVKIEEPADSPEQNTVSNETQGSEGGLPKLAPWSK